MSHVRTEGHFGPLEVRWEQGRKVLNSEHGKSILRLLAPGMATHLGPVGPEHRTTSIRSYVGWVAAVLLEILS